MDSGSWSLLVAVVGLIFPLSILVRSAITYFLLRHSRVTRVKVTLDGNQVVLDSSDPADAEAILRKLLDDTARSRRGHAEDSVADE